MTGSQEPRIKIEPERKRTDGNDAALLMEEYSGELDRWQRIVVDSWLGTDLAGKYTVSTAGLSVPRQNGKNFCLEAREFFGLVIKGEKILHTAHQVRTSKESFRRLAAMFTNDAHPEVEEEVAQIRYTNGEEAIFLRNGGEIRYTARSRQSARGFSGISLVVYDEAQELTDDQIEAITATLSASETGTRQVIYTGTPPYPDCPGVVFRRFRTACLSDPGPHDAWHEWSVAANSVDEIDINNPDIWFMTNPAMGDRLSEAFTAEERKMLSKEGFCRERLGWWSPILTEKKDNAIDKTAWEACGSNKKKPEGKTAFGIKFTPDGAEVILCGAVISKDGKARIEEIERKATSHGIQWLTEWLNQRYTRACCVVIDGRNGVDILCDRIHDTWKAKNSVIRPTARDVIAAASQLITEVNEGTLTWYTLQDDLNDSAVSSVKRPISGGFGFGGDNAGPIEAAALALWGCRNSKRDPNRKMMIG
ncbi:hypothetical protein SAMN02745687_00926 [Lachnospiraceae bacterium NK3A20]|nr:hypothetical protein SAMN02745687_00926 [Lachnospiraceae bacterium NK3A20]